MAQTYRRFGCQAITRVIADPARTIRFPVHLVETTNPIVRTPRQMLKEIGREPRRCADSSIPHAAALMRPTESE
jgi:hypothetical protein